MSWWKRMFGRGSTEASEADEAGSSNEPGASERAEWMEAGAPGNPYDLRILNLMVTQSIMATSSDPAAASRAASWGASTGEELDPTHVLAQPAQPCALEFPCASVLPNGLLYAPPSMDQKWVLAWRDGHLLIARSWTGEVDAVLVGEKKNERLSFSAVHLSAESPLRVDNSVEVLDWLIRCHALDEKHPYPADEGQADLFENVPLTAFS
ncbi:MAG: hypothetical protein AAFQ82_26845, partial [Myxococcota bacterium]